MARCGSTPIKSSTAMTGHREQMCPAGTDPGCPSHPAPGFQLWPTRSLSEAQGRPTSDSLQFVPAQCKTFLQDTNPLQLFLFTRMSRSSKPRTLCYCQLLRGGGEDFGPIGPRGRRPAQQQYSAHHAIQRGKGFHARALITEQGANCGYSACHSSAVSPHPPQSRA